VWCAVYPAGKAVRAGSRSPDTAEEACRHTETLTKQKQNEGDRTHEQRFLREEKERAKHAE
jgi:hypothetical protein